MDVDDKNVFLTELKETKNRKVLDAYARAEAERLNNNIYIPLEKKHPQLHQNIQELRIVENPIDRIEKFRSTFSSVELVKGLAGLANLAVEDNEDVKKIKLMFEKLDPLIALYNKYEPTLIKSYADLVDAVKKVSTKKHISVEKAVNLNRYMDEVSRIATPKRSVAESMLKDSHKYTREMIDIAQGFVAFSKQIDFFEKKRIESEKKIPTRENLDIILKATRDYKMKEFNRIYG